VGQSFDEFPLFLLVFGVAVLGYLEGVASLLDFELGVGKLFLGLFQLLCQSCINMILYFCSYSL
jgi:hypothetical protein